MEYFEEEFDQAVSNIDITPSEVPPSLQWRSLGGPVQRRPVVRWEMGTLEMEVRYKALALEEGHSIQPCHK